MSNSDIVFPFDTFIENDKNRKLFMDDVAQILKTDLQLEDSFGCEITNCHSHLGSKKHLINFIEGELLFHNSYYNKRFAFLTIQTICRNLPENVRKIVLVGYENYCELYLCETLAMLETISKEATLQNVQEIEYCVYEHIGDKIRIRNINTFFSSSVPPEDIFLVLIVPINTTFTTHDKMMEGLDRELRTATLKKFSIKKCSMLNIGLILIASEDENDFWEEVSDGSGNETQICLKKEKQRVLSTLADKKVFYYVKVSNKWSDPNKCEECFPDLAGRPLIEELPNFRMDKASIVPMLQLGKKKYVEPLVEAHKQAEEENIKKVVKLANVSYHAHIKRNGNHYQYYFDTEQYFKNEQTDIMQWLKNHVKKQLHEDRSCYNFIIAPRHYSNARFVRMVNDIVFEGRARIFYFDILKEYRSNVTTKYSDFARVLENIRDANQNYKVNFHFVDDTISSGDNYNRAKSLISTIIGDQKDSNIVLYKSIILLLNRCSNGSKRNYIEDTGNFYSYVNLAISSMRNHEDACSLCRLQTEYRKLQRVAATNEMEKKCRKTVKRHRIRPTDKIKEPTREERLRMVVSHILSVRLSNHWWLDEKARPVNGESVSDIYDELNQIFFNKKIFDYFAFLKGNDLSAEAKNKTALQKDFSNAFIKVITRPFFTNHLRQKQAAMKFCLEQLDMILRKHEDERSIKDTLIKGIADLGANHLLRKEIIDLVMENKGSPSYFKAIKKSTALSGDDTQSYLLECILVNGKEGMFFGKPDNLEQMISNLTFHDWVMLYMENNKVLHDGFKELYRNRQFNRSYEELPYYLETFVNICKLNLSVSQKEKGDADGELRDLCTHYLEIKQLLVSGCKKEAEFDKIENELTEMLGVGKVRFFSQHEEENASFRYFLLNQDYVKDDETPFFCERNLREIEELLKGKSIGKTLYFGDRSCIIRIQIRKKEKAWENSRDLFLQILYKEKPSKTPYAIQNETQRQEAMLILFKIKVILTFRANLVKLGEKQNIANLVEKSYKNEIKEALQIEKAHKHGASEYYEDINIWGKTAAENGKFLLESYLHAENAKERYKDLFDMYMQSLANNYIVSLYRAMVLKNTEKYVKQHFMKAWDMDYWRDEMLPGLGFQEKDNKEPFKILEYQMKVPVDNQHTVIVKMICDFPEDVHGLSIYAYELNSSYGYFVYLTMILFALNAGIHGKKENMETSIFFHFTEDAIIAENKIDKGSKFLEIFNKEEAEPPWRGENKSITLWTFQQLSDGSKGVNGFAVEEKNGNFIVTLKNFVKREEIWIWEQ